ESKREREIDREIEREIATSLQARCGTRCQEDSPQIANGPLYRIYCQTRKSEFHGFFCKNRPQFVKTQQFMKFNLALCEICENIDLKLKVIVEAGITTLGKDRNHLLHLMLCPRAPGARFHHLSCIKLD
ncbi:uncharacterized protein LOC106013527, partial [Aplysia californica]|uniref:Uncharacterized protein LOC106013527 n=1 Tax=Aplysia californica TaxID=6500 RepID=A0ABM1AC96_APLCA